MSWNLAQYYILTVYGIQKLFLRPAVLPLRSVLSQWSTEHQYVSFLMKPADHNLHVLICYQRNHCFNLTRVNEISFLYPPQTLFVGGILFSRCPCVRPSVRASVRPSVTLCFLNNSKSHCWIFIKPCKHVHICKTNTLDKKVRARGQFY